jgi:Holliday junction resolvasome RuvABC endonuclease subunit
MRVQGYDPSSALAAVANAVGGSLVHVDHWKPPKKSSKNDHLLDFYDWVGVQMDTWRPDVVGYERVQSARNLNTVRVLAYWEAAIVLQARRRRIIVQHVNVGQARDVVLGNAKATKEEALAELRRRYPEVRWSASNAGGLDEADAGVVCLATPDLLERR